MHSWTTRRLLESTPVWMVVGIFVLGCGRTEREYEGGPSTRIPELRPIPADAGSGGDDGTGSGGADSSEGGAVTGGAGADQSGSELGAAGQPASGAEPETDPGQEMDPEEEPETEPPVHPSDCTRSSLTVKDPNTGITWNTVYKCGNDGGSGVYEKANYNDKVGIMNSTTSWFVCWKAGADHAGNNNIWYYTQGSVSTAGWGGRAAWGFMPAVDVHTQYDPDSAIPGCSF